MIRHGFGCATNAGLSRDLLSVITIIRIIVMFYKNESEPSKIIRKKNFYYI